MRSSWIGCCCLLGVLAAVPAAGAVAVGQIDDFQDGTTQNWMGGGMGGAPPINVPDGGPDGDGDRFLRIQSVNFNLGTNNTAQWTGDYTAAGIEKLNFHLNNLGETPLALRISLFGSNATFTTTDETVLQPGMGWVSVDFALDEDSLTRTGGTGTLEDTLADVGIFLIRHDPDPISPSGQQNPVTGTLGIDNVSVVPEPGVTAGLFAGIAALAWMGARRRSREGRAG